METRGSQGRRPRRAAATPTGILGAEHDLLLDVVRALDRSLDDSARIDSGVWEDAVAFLRSFGAQHHAKENIVLIAALERQGIPASDQTLRALLEEHEEEGQLLDSMARLLRDAAPGDGDTGSAFRQVARRYCAHLVGHIDREAQFLFPMAETELSPEDERDVLHRFLLYTHAANGEDRYDELLAIADRVRRAK